LKLVSHMDNIISYEVHGFQFRESHQFNPSISKIIFILRESVSFLKKWRVQSWTLARQQLKWLRRIPQRFKRWTQTTSLYRVRFNPFIKKVFYIPRVRCFQHWCQIAMICCILIYTLWEIPIKTMLDNKEKIRSGRKVDRKILPPNWLSFFSDHYYCHL